MMKSRLLDAMGNVLTLVRKSNLAEATALLQRSLGGDAVAARAERGRRRPPDFPSIDQAEPTRSATSATASTAGVDAVAALAQRGRRRAPHFPSIDQAEPTRSATASTTRAPLGE